MSEYLLKYADARGQIKQEVVDGKDVPNAKSGLIWEFSGQPNDTMQSSVAGLCVTNEFVFQAEDFQGNVLTNNQENRVIRMVLEFYQWEFRSSTNTPKKGLYDYYRLQTKLTQRALD